MGCGGSKPDNNPKVPQTAGSLNLPTAAPVQGNTFQLTAATKVVKASNVDPQQQAAAAKASSGSSSSPSALASATKVVAPPILTGCIVFIDQSDSQGKPRETQKKIFAVLDRGVLVTCFPNEESEEEDYVSDPIKLNGYSVIKDPHSSAPTLMLIDSEQKETHLSFDNDKDANKWLSSFQAHIQYRTQLAESSPEQVKQQNSKEEFGGNEVKDYRMSVRRVPKPAGQNFDTRNHVHSAYFSHDDLRKVGIKEEEEEETFSGGIVAAAAVAAAADGNGGNNLATPSPPPRPSAAAAPAPAPPAARTPTPPVAPLTPVDTENIRVEISASSIAHSPGHAEPQTNPLAGRRPAGASGAGAAASHSHAHAPGHINTTYLDGEGEVEYNVEYSHGDTTSPKFSYSRDKM